MVRRLLFILLLTGISSLLFGVGMFAGGSKNTAAAGDPGEIPILMYHKINPDPCAGGLGLRVPPAKFAEQMEYLARHGYQTVSLAEAAAWIKGEGKLPARPVVLTFDDGYLDNYQYAFPVLKKYGFTATVFVVAGCAGGTNAFDVRAGRQPENRLAGWPELAEMARSGITIGAHTLDHPRLTEVPPEEALRQIKRSREVIEKKLNRPVLFFSYPYGSYNGEVLRLVKESGYLAAVTTTRGLATRRSNPYALKRIRIMGNYDLKKFISELTGSK